MDIIFEILFDIIVEGPYVAVTERRVPLLLRIAAGILLIAVFGGLATFLILYGINNEEWLLAAAGAALLVFFIFGAVKVFKKRRRGEKKESSTPEE